MPVSVWDSHPTLTASTALYQVLLVNLTLPYCFEPLKHLGYLWMSASWLVTPPMTRPLTCSYLKLLVFRHHLTEQFYWTGYVVHMLFSRDKLESYGAFKVMGSMEELTFERELGT